MTPIDNGNDVTRHGYCKPRSGYPRVCDVSPGAICRWSGCIEWHRNSRDILIQADHLDLGQFSELTLARRPLLDRGSTVWSVDTTLPKRAAA